MNIYKFSKWASEHVLKTQLVLFFIRILLLLNAICLGSLLYLANLVVSPVWIWTTALLFGFLFILYPSKKESYSWFPNTFRNRKILDGGLTLVGFLFVLGCVNKGLMNQDPTHTESIDAYAQLVVYKPNLSKEKVVDKLANIVIVKEYRLLKKRYKAELKALKKELRQSKDIGNKGMMILWISLSSILAVALMFLSLLLSCSLLCSGSDVLGVMVFVLGIVGVPIVLFFTIRAIVRKYRFEEEIIYK